jgi:SET domain-containing protein
MSDLVEARASEIHGTGVFALAEIAEGTFIGEYEGDATDVDGTYVLWIEDDDAGSWRGIDGTGVLRFLNHSRTPNVEFDGPQLHALCDIAAGEELCFDYGADWSHVP